jgi:hypothetical protein
MPFICVELMKLQQNELASQNEAELHQSHPTIILASGELCSHRKQDVEAWIDP